MSEEEKKAIELLKNIEKNKQKCLMLECPVVKNNVKRQLKIIELKKELDKKDKVINEICKYINEAGTMKTAIPIYSDKENTPYTVGVASVEEIKEYFYKKVEEENE